jgi:hypothetical protein
LLPAFLPSPFDYLLLIYTYRGIGATVATIVLEVHPIYVKYDKKIRMFGGGIKEVQISLDQESRQRRNTGVYREGDRLFPFSS